MWLGLDSTDSREGGCTTHAALTAIARLPGVVLRGPPRLVRLNPNVPYKTRGNGAVAFALGHARGEGEAVAEVEGRALRAFPDAARLARREREAVFRRLVEAVGELRSNSSSANTGLVAFPEPPPVQRYEEAVSREVREAILDGAEFHHAWGNGRGLIGAVAACAWPAKKGTYEMILYRRTERIGTPRRLRPDLGPLLDRVPGTFDNWDPTHGHLRVAPASPCPVLCGIRGTDAHALLASHDLVGPEAIAGWGLFATNQATGDHVRDTTVADLRPYDAVRLRLQVSGVPDRRRGGHVFVDAEDETGAILLAAYEPTKEFRRIVETLQPGDQIEAEGGVHDDPSVLALEAFTLLAASPRGGFSAPTCAACGGRMRSAGRRAPYRCPRDGTKAPPLPAAAPARREVGARVTAPVLVRRHLQRPSFLLEPDLRLGRRRLLA